MKPRVFVSSVIEGFEEYRNAVRSSIIEVGGEPVLVEDFPSLSLSPYNACLDGVDGSDIFILIIGERGGWVSPSRKLVVHEEYDEAVRKKLKILVFIKKTQHDETAKSLIKIVSDYVDGLFRLAFFTVQELQMAVKKSLSNMIEGYGNLKVNMKTIEEKIQAPEKFCNETCLRFVICPERIDEHIDPINLESKELKDKLLELTHKPNVELFSYEYSKSTEVRVNEIIISQIENRHRDHIVNDVRLELSTSANLIIDLNVTGLSKDENYNSLISMTIQEEDVMRRLRTCFAFVRAYFESVDPTKRYDRLYYNAALYQLRNKCLMDAPPKGSISMPYYEKDLVQAFDNPRLVTRRDLLTYENEVKAILIMFRRRLRKE